VGGTNRQVWIDKFKKEQGLSDAEAAARYDTAIRPKVLDAIEKTKVRWKPADDDYEGHAYYSHAFGDEEGGIYLSPGYGSTPTTFSHEMAHAIDDATNSTASRSQQLKTVFPELDSPESETPFRQPGKRYDQELDRKWHSYRSPEVYADIIQTRRDLGRKFTPEDIKAIRSGNTFFYPKLHNSRLGDLEDALGRRTKR
jgi:hypothetical protein